MGLQSEQDSSVEKKKVYLSIREGKFFMKAELSTKGAVSRTNSNGKVVSEVQFSRLNNVYLTNIYIDNATFSGKEKRILKIECSEGDTDYLINTEFAGRIANLFLKTLPNIDLTQPISIKPNKSNGKDYLNIYQGDKELQFYFTRENKNGLPEAIQGTDMKWDFSEQQKFFEYLIKGVAAKLKPEPEPESEQPNTPSQEYAEFEDMPAEKESNIFEKKLKKSKEAKEKQNNNQHPDQPSGDNFFTSIPDGLPIDTAPF